MIDENARIALLSPFSESLRLLERLVLSGVHVQNQVFLINKFADMSEVKPPKTNSQERHIEQITYIQTHVPRPIPPKGQ